MFSVWTCLPCVVTEILSFRWGQGKCLDLCPVPSYIDRIHPDYIPLLQIDQVFELRPAPDHAEKLAQRAHLTSPPQFISVWNTTTSSTSGADRTGEPVTAFLSSSAADKLVSAAGSGPNVTMDRVLYENTKGTFAPAVFLLLLQNTYLDVLEVWNSREFWTEAFGILVENWGWWLCPLAVACVLPFCAFFVAVWCYFWFQVSNEQLSYIDHAISPQSALDDERAAEARPLSEILIPRNNNHYDGLFVELTREKEQNAQLVEQKQSLLQELSEEKSKNGRLLTQKDVTETKNQKILTAIQARIVELEAQVEADAEKQTVIAANQTRIAQLEAQVKVESEKAALLTKCLKRSHATRKEEKKRFVKTYILGLNRWKNVTEEKKALRAEISKGKAKCADLEVKYDNLDQMFDTLQQKSTASQQAAENEKKALQDQITLEKQKAPQLEAKYNNLEQNSTASHAAIENEKKVLQDQITLEKQKCAHLEKKYAELEQKYDSIDKNATTSLKAVQEEKMIIEAGLRSEKEQNAYLKSKYDTLEANYTGSQEDLKEVDGMLTARNDDYERSETARKKLQGDLWAAQTTIGECNTKLAQAEDTIAQANQKAADFESKYKTLEQEIEIGKENLREELREEYDADLAREEEKTERFEEENAALKKELATYKLPLESPDATNDTSNLTPEEDVDESAADTSLIDNKTSGPVSDGEKLYDADTVAAETPEALNPAADEENVDAVNDAAQDDVAKTLMEELGISLEIPPDDADLFGDVEEPARGATNTEDVPEATNEAPDDNAPPEIIDQAEEAAPEETGNEAAEDSDEDSLWGERELQREAASAMQQGPQVDQVLQVEEDQEVVPSIDNDDSIFGERELQREAASAMQQGPQADQVVEGEDKDDVPSMVVIRSLYPTVTLPLYSLLGDYENESIVYDDNSEWVPQDKIVDQAKTQEEKDRITRLTGTHWIVYDGRRDEISAKGVSNRVSGSRMKSIYNAVRRSACATMGLIEHTAQVQQRRTPEELSELPLSLMASNATNNYWYEKDPSFPESRRRRHSIAYGDLDETILKKTGGKIPRRTPNEGIGPYPVYKGPLNTTDMLAVKRLSGANFDLLQQQRDRIVARVPAVQQRSLTELFFKVKGSESSTRISGDSKASLIDILAIDNLRQHQVDAGRGEASLGDSLGLKMDVTRSIWSKSLKKNEIIEVRTLNHLHGAPPSPAKVSSPAQPVPGAFPSETPPSSKPNNSPPANAPTGPAADRNRTTFAATAGTSTSTPVPAQVRTPIHTHTLPLGPPPIPLPTWPDPLPPSSPFTTAGPNPLPPFNPFTNAPVNAPPANASRGPAADRNTWTPRPTTTNTNNPSPTAQLMQGGFMYGTNGFGTQNNLSAAFTFNADEFRQEDNDNGGGNGNAQRQQQQPFAFNPPTGPRAMENNDRAGGSRGAGAGGSGMGSNSSTMRGRVQYERISRFGGLGHR